MKYCRRIAAMGLSIMLLWGGAVPALAAEEAALRMLGKAHPLTAADFGADAVWTSSDETVAGVSSGGLVTAWVAGTAEISVLAKDGRTEVFSLRVEPALAGDADDNGVVDVSDARTALRAAVGLVSYPAGSLPALLCDADGDGETAVTDARLILRTAVGLEKTCPLHAHVFGGETEVPPDCERDGEIYQTCRICGKKESSPLPALGHDFQLGENAFRRVCVRCGRSECDALGHDFASGTLRESTCAAPGILEKVCLRCGRTENEDLPQPPHTWLAATCTAPRTCAVCGGTEGEPLGHRWQAADCTKPKTCTVCGGTEGDPLGHRWQPAGCTKPRTCSVCGKTEGAPLGHSWQAAGCTKPKTCARCGAAEGKALGHVWQDATYTKPKTCTRCGSVEGKPLGKVIGVSKKGYTIAVYNGVTYVDDVLVANKTYALPRSYAPGDLTAECRAAFKKMQSAAARQGLSIYVSSGYRSYDLQNSLYHRYASRDGYAAADRYSARPGHSEHQTGLAMDLNTITNSFAYTAEGKWVAAHCHEYGFILRYPQGKESQTGYMYEPWHLRYLGVEKATAIRNSGLTLEEYYGITSAYS